MSEHGESAEIIAAPARRGLLSPRVVTMIARLQGVLMAIVLTATIVQTFIGAEWLRYPAEAAVVVFLVSVAFVGSTTARVFLVIALICIPVALTWIEDPWTLLEQGIARSQSFLAFFTAILSLHEPAFNSPMIQEAGRFVARQPGARRTLTMMLGGHLFGLMLNVGSMVLLGSLTMSRRKGTKPVRLSEPEIRQAAIASLRGFNSTAMWSPLSLTPLVVTALVPGITSQALIPAGLVCAAITLTIGFLVSRHQDREVETARDSEPLEAPVRMFGPVPVALLRILLLVATMFAAILAVSKAANASIAVTVTLVIPAFSLAWMLLQSRGDVVRCVRGPIASLVFRVWPAQSPEVTLMAAAGFASPVIAAAIPSEAIAGWLKSNSVHPALIGVMSFLAVFLGGLIGINPLIAIAVVVGIVSDPASLGLDIAYFAMVLIVAWSFTAQLSPFTASTLLCARLYNTTSFRIAFVWQRLFAIICISLSLAAILIIGLLI